jgi:hypothetical protein
MGRALSHIALIVAAFALAGARPPDEAKPNGNAAGQVGPTATPAIGYTPYPNYKSSGCYQDKNHDAADLCAQWRAAIAAEKATHFADVGNYIDGAGALLSFISIILVIVALGKAQKANEIASKHSHADLRPYVYLSHQDFTYSEVIPGMVGQVGNVTLHLKNFGRTPAKQVILTATLKVGGYWSDSPPKLEEEPTKIHMGDLPPDKTVERDGFTVTDLFSNQADIANAVASVFLFGRITYKDASGEGYQTDFRLASSGPEFHEHRFSVCPKGNEAT